MGHFCSPLLGSLDGRLPFGADEVMGSILAKTGLLGWFFCVPLVNSFWKGAEKAQTKRNICKETTMNHQEASQSLDVPTAKTYVWPSFFSLASFHIAPMLGCGLGVGKNLWKMFLYGC